MARDGEIFVSETLDLYTIEQWDGAEAHFLDGPFYDEQSALAVAEQWLVQATPVETVQAEPVAQMTPKELEALRAVAQMLGDLDTWSLAISARYGDSKAAAQCAAIMRSSSRYALTVRA
jgi:hypothetical protein